MSNMKKHSEVRPRAELRKLHFVDGGGGLKSILAGAGSKAAVDLAGTIELVTIGGCSGGSLATAIIAGGASGRRMFHMAIETDFSSLVTGRGWPRKVVENQMTDNRVYGWYAVTTVAKRVKKFFARWTPGWMKKVWNMTFGQHDDLVVRPKEGIYGSEKIGVFIDKHVPEFPANYWSVAVDGNTSSQIFFCKEGVFEYHPDGHKETIAEAPVTPGFAVRSSIAIPLFFGSIPFAGKHLLDGSLTFDGRTPVGAVKRHFDANPEDILVLDMWDSSTNSSWFEGIFWKSIWFLFCGGSCPQGGRFPSNFEGVMLVQPQVDSRITLQFAATADEKWPAIMAGFESTAKVLEANGLLAGEKLAHANAIMETFTEIKKTAKLKGELAARTQEMLTEYHLW